MKLRTQSRVMLGLSSCLLLVLCPAGAQAGGGEWEVEDPPPTTRTLQSVWGSSGSDVFAVGRNGTILHYNGTSWSPMKSSTTQWLHGVWGSSGSDVFAVGSGGTILHCRDGKECGRTGCLGSRCLESRGGARGRA